ncbi:S-adenosyl-L-methionine-dependent methyltransferase [Panus rudis PR-1116 ss-1]|nr:S-adenosyl-L-methionine-dependent methyltransferase [Panus rudis PR-1116 ss-1]
MSSISEHHHDHAGHHHHDGIHDYAQANREHYNKDAERMEMDEQAKKLAHRTVQAILKQYPGLLNEDTTSVLDFACGTGLVSRELAPHVKSILGVDVSQKAVDIYNERVANQGIPPDEMRAVCVELKGEPEELDGAKFDVITCAAAYHHFASVEDMTRILVSFLKPGGSLIITDIIKSEQDIVKEEYRHIVAHARGFSEDDIRNLFENAGLTDFKYAFFTKATFAGMEISFFIARGTKPV